jgi:hypothetical protein
LEVAGGVVTAPNRVHNNRFPGTAVLSKNDSTPTPPARKPARPEKPSPDFPFFARAAGVWAKKIRGKIDSIAPWRDPQEALVKYTAQKEDLHAGRKPRP